MMRWLQHDPTTREQHLPLLLQHVRLPLLPPKFLIQVVAANRLIRGNEFCRDLIDEAKDYLLLPQERARMQGTRTKPRRPFTPSETLFVVGGWCSGDGEKIEIV